MEDHHGDDNNNEPKLDFDPTPPARVELRSHPYAPSSSSNSSSNKLYQRYSMSVLDGMNFGDDDITATIADV